MDRHMLTAAVVGALVVGFGSAIPLLNLGNCLCCMWVWGGGLVATLAYVRMSGRGCGAGKGLLLGLLAGLLGALLFVVLSTLMNLAGFGGFKENFEKIMSQVDVDKMVQSQQPENREQVRALLGRLKNLDARQALFSFILVVASIYGVAGFILGSLGGLLGSLVTGGAAAGTGEGAGQAATPEPPGKPAA